MTVTKEQVRTKINASARAVTDDEIQAAIDVAMALVNAHVDQAEVPPEVLDRAVLLVAVEQINQDKAPNGVLNQVYDTGLGEEARLPVRVGRDPMKPAYPVLDPWVGGRFFCA